MTCKTCPKCGAVFKHPSHCYRHMRRCGTPEHRVSCHHCDKTFPRKDLWQRHMKKAHPVQKTFCCSTCNKAFEHEMALQHHEERCGKDRPKPFNCANCFEKHFPVKPLFNITSNTRTSSVEVSVARKRKIQSGKPRKKSKPYPKK